MEDITPEQVDFFYQSLRSSTLVINDVLEGKRMSDRPVAERKERIQRNIDHIEYVLAKDFWTDQDMTPFLAAVAAGKNYIQTAQ